MIATFWLGCIVAAVCWWGGWLACWDRERRRRWRLISRAVQEELRVLEVTGKAADAYDSDKPEV